MKEKIKEICESLNREQASVYGATNELFDLFVVSQQRELLKAYAELIQSSYTNHFFDDAVEESIDEFLSL
jgi:predicted transcriptional regulator